VSCPTTPPRAAPAVPATPEQAEMGAVVDLGSIATPAGRRSRRLMKPNVQ
jgi:hypothetical protein